MKKKKQTQTCFSEVCNARQQRKKISDASVALIVSGIVLAAVSGLRCFVSTGAAAAVSGAAAVCGLALVFAGAFFPKQLLPVTDRAFAFFNKAGTAVLRVLLVPVYVLMFLATFWYAKLKKKDYRFVQWEGAPPVRDSFFEETAGVRLNNRKAFRVLGGIFADVAAHKSYVLLPLIAVLLLIGLLFFFLSSSSVFSFIYTFV